MRIIVIIKFIRRIITVINNILYENTPKQDNIINWGFMPMVEGKGRSYQEEKS